MNRTVKVLRRGPVRYVEGRILQDQTEEISVAGNIQPERNIILIREVFGSHIEAALKIYTNERLRTQEKGCDADVVLYDGREWEVSQVRRYEDVIPHYKTIAILKKDET